jgi:hypothetical protein
MAQFGARTALRPTMAAPRRIGAEKTCFGPLGTDRTTADFRVFASSSARGPAASPPFQEPVVLNRNDDIAARSARHPCSGDIEQNVE